MRAYNGGIVLVGKSQGILDLEMCSDLIISWGLVSIFSFILFLTNPN